MSLYKNLVVLKIIVGMLFSILAGYIFYNEEHKKDIKLVHLTCEILHKPNANNIISFKCLEN